MSDPIDPALAGRFAHLHCHSHYSFLDGGVRVESLVNRAREFGMPALAVTDHGNMCSAMDLWDACDDESVPVKPIFGTELYITTDHTVRDSKVKDRYHLLTLAMNPTGYQNLVKLNSYAHRDGFYHKPRIDFDMLAAHSEGLITTSTDIGGKVAQLIIAGEVDQARQEVGRFREVFGDRYYLEFQEHGLHEENIYNAELWKIHQETGIDFVVTQDAHYLNQDDAEAHDALLCISTGSLLSDSERLRFDSDQFYFKSTEEMWAVTSPHLRPGLFRTGEIADRVESFIKFGDYHLPAFPDLPEGVSDDDFLRQQSIDGIGKRYGKMTDALRERMDYELGVIAKMGFSSYFLIVSDFIKWAKQHDIAVGPGRGSAAGSIVAYATEITDVDPLEYDLLFERFLNPSRVSMPDIDIDFDPEGREAVIEYTRQKYGNDSVCQIITFSQLKAKAVVRDVGRVMDVPIPEIESMTKLIPEEPKMTLAKALEIEPKLTEIRRSNARYGKLFDTALRLEGLNRHTGIHAAGVIIAPEAVENFIPLYRQKGEIITTQFAMEHCERLGLLKMDFLGLRNLTIIKRCIEIIRRVHGIDIDLTSLPLDDPKTYELLQRGDTFGVFQVESDGMRKLLKRLKPDCFDDVIAVLAMYRPGPLGSGMVDTYVEVKHGRQEQQSLHPLIDDILAETNGVILYQEQVMRIASQMAGFSLAEADKLRKAMGKKKADLMDKFKSQFIAGAGEKGVDPGESERIFDLMAYFAGYGFNKSHSAAYAFITYQTGYLKANYPVEYEAAIMTCEMGEQSKLAQYLDDARELQIPVRGPDITVGEAGFTVAPVRPEELKQVRDADRAPTHAIVFGLGGVKGIGVAVIDSIVAERDANGPFATLLDFAERIDPKLVNTSMLDKLARCGALDALAKVTHGQAGEEPADFARRIRPRLAAAADTLHSIAVQAWQERTSGQAGLFGGGDDGADDTARQIDALLPAAPEWADQDLLSAEKEMLGFYFSTHPLARHARLLGEFTSHTTSQMFGSAGGTRVVAGGMIVGFREPTIRAGRNAGRKMGVFQLADMEGQIGCVCFSNVYERLDPSVFPADDAAPTIVLVKGSIDDGSKRGGRNGGNGNGANGGSNNADQPRQILVDDVIPIDRAYDKMTGLVELTLDADAIDDKLLSRIRMVLSANMGDVPVQFNVRSSIGRAVLRTGQKFRVRPSASLRETISEMLGPAAMVCKMQRN
jgi:DNA polymerase-3 subunit alpha